MIIKDIGEVVKKKVFKRNNMMKISKENDRSELI